MSNLRLFLFGPPRLELNGQPVEIGLRKAQALLAYLAVTDQPQSRDTLAAMFWPESSQSKANLRRTLYRLNRALGADVLDTEAETVSIDEDANLWLDVLDFRRLITGCLDRAGDVLCQSRLEQAAALVAGPFMQGFTLPDALAFDEWQFFERDALQRTAATVFQTLAREAEATRAWESAIEHARRWLAQDTLNEPAHRLLMRLYASAGQQAAALRQYEACARLLQEELGVEPEPATAELYEQLKKRRATATELKGSAGRQPVRAQIPYTQYVASGEVHIAYQVLGQGPPDVVFVPGFVSHLEHAWQDPGLADFMHRLARHCRLILFDKRGIGLSDRVGYPPTLENTMDDILAVMDAVGATEPFLFGVSEGGPNCALFAATYPQRLSGLILFGTIPRFSRADDYPWALPRSGWDRWTAELIRHWGSPVSLEHFAPSRASEPKFQRWWAQMLRLSSSPGGVKAVLEIARDIDVRHVLPSICVPTLVIHRRDDRMMWVQGARLMAQLIPQARYVELPGADHWWWVGDSGAILQNIEEFLAELPGETRDERVLATIVVFPTDDATKKAHLDVEAAHFRGRPLRRLSTSTGYYFDGPSRALAFARAAQSHPFTLQAGVHTGECLVQDGELVGPALQIAEAIALHAQSGEVLVSSTVKDLVAGSGFHFGPRGDYQVPVLDHLARLFALS